MSSFVCNQRSCSGEQVHQGCGLTVPPQTSTIARRDASFNVCEPWAWLACSIARARKRPPLAKCMAQELKERISRALYDGGARLLCGIARGPVRVGNGCIAPPIHANGAGELNYRKLLDLQRHAARAVLIYICPDTTIVNKLRMKANLQGRQLVAQQELNLRRLG